MAFWDFISEFQAQKRDRFIYPLVGERPTRSQLLANARMIWFERLRQFYLSPSGRGHKINILAKG
ncbi:hypothetical protein ASG68_27260 [Rhizobium sp. Leaf453]|nr:hypothetical protein ASG42_25855 [Rhizobium sp. Leaf391]KQU03371.1 hypothetical protein ASG68_27260 [Rhizobium sp. Leaf453]